MFAGKFPIYKNKDRERMWVASVIVYPRFANMCILEFKAYSATEIDIDGTIIKSSSPLANDYHA